MSEESTRVQADTLADITAFDAVAVNEAACEIELKHLDGTTGTGVFVSVIGRHSDAVTKWRNKIINQRARDEHMAERRGKAAPPKTMEELFEQNLDGAVLIVTGWRNVKQPFDREVLRQALKRNPHWMDQIYDASNDLGNFLKAQQPN